jgi:hypothetical protein
LQHPPTLAFQSKPLFIAILPKQLVENFPMVGYFPTCMHMGASTSFANITNYELIPKNVLISNLKVLGQIINM